jgi:SP family sugar:H+ symporter-like MFS transporter
VAAHGGALPEPGITWLQERTARAPTATVTRLAAVAAIGGFLFGYESAVINGAVSAIGSRFAAGGLVLGLTVSAVLLGAAAGSVMAGRVADHTGRVRAMQMAAVLFLASALGAGLAGSLASAAGRRAGPAAQAPGWPAAAQAPPRRPRDCPRQRTAAE